MKSSAATAAVSVQSYRLCAPTEVERRMGGKGAALARGGTVDSPASALATITGTTTVTTRFRHRRTQ
jgi:hypothetical protein